MSELLQNTAIHTFTTKPWSLQECIEHYARAGIGGISIWKETLGDTAPETAVRWMNDAGIQATSFVRGGFFTSTDPAERKQAVAETKRLLHDASALGCPMLVLVCGATPGQTVQENLAQIAEGLVATAATAQDLGVHLAVEPLHPNYAGDRSAIASMACANDLCDQINHPMVGIALDVYHVWWEHNLREQIQRAARKNRLLGYHICDFKTDAEHPLLDRGLMGEGCIPLKEIDRWMQDTGFSGFREVEIFSQKFWKEKQHDYLTSLIRATQQIYTTALTQETL